MMASPFEALLKHLGHDVKVARFSVDAPAVSDGEWWLDIELEGGWSNSISWRPDRKFGFYVTGGEFGERPDEIFGDERLAATRLVQLFRRHQAQENAAAFSLREIRQLLGESQEVMAENLGKGQAEISRFEKRSDAKLSTIDQYVRSLGGRLQVSVVFDDFEGPLELAQKPKPKPKPISKVARKAGKKSLAHKKEARAA